MPIEARPAGVRRFFSRGGTLSEWHPNYEFRPGQVEMAEAVEAALRDKRHLIVEAGTGTGKTLAYLVPALLSGKRIVVSTGTKNLQEQLFFKDVPFLQQHFPRPLKVCYMKGRNNYACRQKIYDAEKRRCSTGLEEVADFQIIREWEKTTEFGDRAEIKTLPEGSHGVGQAGRPQRPVHRPEVPAISSAAFITLMHQRAAESDIIIVNHHLFFADLSLQATTNYEGGILPEYHAVVFDEAHEIEDVAGQYFGVAVSNYRFQDLRRDISAVGRMKNSARRNWTACWSGWTRSPTQFFGLFGEAERPRSLSQDRDGFREDNEEIYSDLLAALDLVGSHLKLMQESAGRDPAAVRRAGELSDGLHFVMEEDDERYVYWVERRGRGMLSAGHAHRGRRHSGGEAVRQGGDGGADLGHAGGSGRLRIRAEAAGAGESAHAGRARAISTTRSRRCCTCRSICRSRATRRSPRPRRKRS